MTITYGPNNTTIFGTPTTYDSSTSAPVASVPTSTPVVYNPLLGKKVTPELGGGPSYTSVGSENTGTIGQPTKYWDGVMVFAKKTVSSNGNQVTVIGILNTGETETISWDTQGNLIGSFPYTLTSDQSTSLYPYAVSSTIGSTGTPPITQNPSPPASSPGDLLKAHLGPGDGFTQNPNGSFTITEPCQYNGNTYIASAVFASDGTTLLSLTFTDLVTSQPYKKNTDGSFTVVGTASDGTIVTYILSPSGGSIVSRTVAAPIPTTHHWCNIL